MNANIEFNYRLTRHKAKYNNFDGLQFSKLKSHTCRENFKNVNFCLNFKKSNKKIAYLLCKNGIYFFVFVVFIFF